MTLRLCEIPWMIARDSKAVRRGVSVVRLHPDDWETLGEPTSILLGDGNTVPIEPTGRKRNWVRWMYRKKRRPWRVPKGRR
jgi:hypothetical protein